MRMTRNDYDAPGSEARLQEAAIALLDADSEDDEAYARARARWRSALKGYTRSVVERLTAWQRRGGHARWRGMTAEQRKNEMRKVREALLCKHTERVGAEARGA